MAVSNPTKVVVLLSGSGTTFAAIEQYTKMHNTAFKITHVVSDNPRAFGLQRAHEAGIETRCVCYADQKDRAAFDQALLVEVTQLAPDLVVLAGYMRIVDREFVAAFDGRLLNIHPSLLPKYPGLNTYQRALNDKQSRHGSSVHFVNNVLDGGPVISQVSVNIEHNDTKDTLSARVQRAERKLYPIVIEWFATGRLEQRDGMVWFEGKPLREPRQFYRNITSGDYDFEHH